YRSARPMGADGAGRYRGGRTLREGAIPWGVPGMAAALYVDESFPKSVGPFGANPGSAGKFRVKHQTDVGTLLASGTVPTDLDALPGVEQPTTAKGPMLMLGPDTVFEWSAANATGYGDPLQREPQAVLADVFDGVIDETTAAGVYGVIVADGDVDATATERERTGLLRERLGGPKHAIVDTISGDAHVQPLGGELGVVVDDEGHPTRFVTVTGRADLGPAEVSYKDGCAVRERPLRVVAPEFGTTEDRPGRNVLLREYLCPRTGLRVGTEILREGDEPLHDIRFGAESAK
ncbi:MAG TPA: acetone carboxylase subunit gamma, partial [Amycolatopsis sp.]|nr:acetone carboxylase subunit gamma [Amycolatopsis sp.]